MKLGTVAYLLLIKLIDFVTWSFYIYTAKPTSICLRYFILRLIIPPRQRFI